VHSRGPEVQNEFGSKKRGGENGVPKIIFGNGSQKIWNGSQKLGTVTKKTKLKNPENEVPKIFFKILTFIDYFIFSKGRGFCENFHFSANLDVQKAKRKRSESEAKAFAIFAIKRTSHCECTPLLKIEHSKI